MARNVIEIVARGKDLTSGVFSKMARGTTASIGKITKSVFNLRTAFITLAGAGGVGLLARNILGMAGDFNKAMANVSTLVNTNVTDMDKLKKGILDMTTSANKSATELSRGLYGLLSAQVKNVTEAESGVINIANALKTLETISKTATAGLTDVNTTTRALTATLNAYGLAAEDANDVSDVFFKTVELGQITFEELATSIGFVLGPAANLNIRIEELFSSIATLTKGGLPAQRVMTGLRALFSSLLTPSNMAKNAAEELGIEWNSLAIKSRGLINFLRDLKKSLDDYEAKTGDSSEITGKLVPEVRALTAVLGLVDKQYESLNRDIKLMGDRTGSADAAFRKIKDSWQEQIKNIGLLVDQIKIGIGEEAFPVLLKFLNEHIKPIIKGIRDWVEANRELIRQKFQGFFDRILTYFDSFVKGMKEVINQSHLFIGVFKLVTAAATAVAAGMSRAALAFARLQLIKKMAEGVGKTGEELTKVATEIKELKDRIQELNDEAYDLGEKTLKQFGEALDTLKGKSGGSSDAIEKLIAALRRVKEESEGFVGPPAPEKTISGEGGGDKKESEGFVGPLRPKLEKKQISQMNALIAKGEELRKSRTAIFMQDIQQLEEAVRISNQSEEQKRKFLQATSDLKLDIFQQENEEIAEKEQQAAEERARIRMDELQKVADHGDSLAEVMSAKIQLFAANAQSVTSIMADTIIQIGGMVKGAIDDSLYALITGAGDMEQIWTSLWQSMLRAVISAVTTIIAQYLIMTAAALLGAKTQNIAEMASNATEVYGNSFASAAAIPEIGWIIAPGAAQANLATFLALAPLAAAAGAGAASSTVALAEGGIVDAPTLALIGEAGPEAVIPLSGPEAQRRLGRGVTINNLTLELFPNISDGSFLFNVPRTKLEQWTRKELLPVFDSLNERNIRPQRG